MGHEAIRRHRVRVRARRPSALPSPPRRRRPSSAVPPRAQLRSFVCRRAAAIPPARTISVTAVMRPVTGTTRMQVRFELLSRPRSGGAFSAVRGGDLGTWLSPIDQPTLGQRPGDVWIVNHPVVDLPAPATYRLRVVVPLDRRQRPGARHHARVTSDTATSPSCARTSRSSRSRSSRSSATPNLDSYVALIRNGGATAAGPFAGRVRSRPARGRAAPRATPVTEPRSARTTSGPTVSVRRARVLHRHDIRSRPSTGGSAPTAGRRLQPRATTRADGPCRRRLGGAAAPTAAPSGR